MRRAKRFGLAAAVGFAASSGAFAQTTGTTGGTSTGSTSTTTGGTTTAATGGGTTTGLTTTTPGLSNGIVFPQTAQISGMSIGQTTSTSSNALDASNGLRTFYANPFFQGAAGATENTAPGGFGTALYGGTTSGRGVATGSSRTIGSTSNSTRASSGNSSASSLLAASALGGAGAAPGVRSSLSSTGFGGTTGGRGLTSGFGGTGGRGGVGGATTQTIANLLPTTNSVFTAAAQGGQIVPLPRPIAYVADLRFPIVAPTPAAVQSDLQAVLDRSTQVSTPRGVQVFAQAGGAVTLRGTVKDEDEARLAEGMVLLTPGVREVRNELTFPKPTGTP